LRPQLLVFSANSQTSLKAQIETYKTYAHDHPEAISDIAYTLAAHREKLPQRAFAVYKDGELEASGIVKAPASSPGITMVFSGQGSQWPEMGKQLILTSASFRNDLATMDTILQGFKKAPSWSILGM
jgi:acyl transferase domain-containing protein